MPAIIITVNDLLVNSTVTSHRESNRFDILRLVAAWLVLFSHCFKLAKQTQGEPLAGVLGITGIDTYGGLGVAVFFILSGYLVTISLERSPNLFEFARRRALRIYPGLVMVCMLSALILGPLMTSEPFIAYWKSSVTWDYLKTASGFFIHYSLPGVFNDNPVSDVNGSLWSLPYEITCYGVLALLGVLPGALRVKTSLAMAFLMLVFLLRPPVVQMGPFISFLGLDYYHTKLGLFFAVGAVCACWRSRVRVSLWPGILAFVVAFLLPFGPVQQLLFVLGFSALTLWLALTALWLPRIPTRFGDWSYGGYLYAFPVQQVLVHYKVHEVSFGGYVALCTVLTFALAGLSWHLLEKQALRWK